MGKVKPSIRLQTILSRNGLSLSQAFKMSDSELLALRQFGEKSLAELRELAVSQAGQVDATKRRVNVRKLVSMEMWVTSFGPTLRLRDSDGVVEDRSYPNIRSPEYHRLVRKAQQSKRVFPTHGGWTANW